MTGPKLDAKITTRNARARLDVGTHWRSIDPDIHLGYRKESRGGRWKVRWYVGDKKYNQLTIGTADDNVAVGTLNFDAAVAAARERVVAEREAAERAAIAPAETIRTVVEGYIKMRNARRSAHAGRKVKSDADSRMTKHVLSKPIASIELAALTEEDLITWKEALNSRLKATSRARSLSDLKAALNAAHKKYRKRLPPEFGEIIRFGLAHDESFEGSSSPSRENQILEDDVVRQVVQAAATFDDDGDIGLLVLVLAATGARFSQAQRLKVRDVQPERSWLMMPKSRKGRHKQDGYYPVQIGADVLEALRPLWEGRGRTSRCYAAGAIFRSACANGNAIGVAHGIRPPS